MRILIAGLGSIGQRHARNLRLLLGNDVELLAWRVRNRSSVISDDRPAGPTPEEAYGIRRVGDLAAGLAERPAAVFVTNPSSMHLAVAQAAADAGCALFIEKPLAHEWAGVEALIETVERRSLVAVVGYQLRFHGGLRRMRQLLDDGTIGRTVAARLDFGEYLPDWHPYEDYRDSYAAQQRLGGGVLLSQSHEFDYACWLWGTPDRVHAAGGHATSLDVDVEDFAIAQLDYGADAAIRAVTVHLDYLRRPPVRTCEVIGDRGRLGLDLLSGALTRTDIDGTVHVENHACARNDLFLAELRHFLACIAGAETPLISLRDAASSLRVALAARQSLEERRPVVLARRSAVPV